MPRFVVLWHETPPDASRASHFDLMLEDEAALLTWASVEPLDSVEPCSLLELPPHRSAYLDYEGPVSNNRGQVTRRHRGEFVWIERTPNRLIVELHGETLRGRATLERIERSLNGAEGSAARDANETAATWRWTLTPRPETQARVASG
ncbi:MAG TPA: hypothetical protein VGE52_16475 [Pirellulales bacterium]